MTASSVRTAHHRHRQHKPGCKFYQQQQAQAQQQTPPGAHLAPSSPSTGGLLPQSSLRTALQQLETMASYRAGRIMDKLNAGLQKMASHRVFDGVLRQGMVGREVRASSCSNMQIWRCTRHTPRRAADQCKRACRCLIWLCLGHPAQWGCSVLTQMCLLVLQVMRDWELGPTLGVGASCVTRLVTEKTTGCTAACKSISKQGILHSQQVKAAMLAVQREVAILQVGHDAVVASRVASGSSKAWCRTHDYVLTRTCMQQRNGTHCCVSTKVLTSACLSCCGGVIKVAGSCRL